MIHIIVDDIENPGREKAGKTANKAMLATALGAGVQLGVTIVNCGGKAVSVIKNAWNMISNNLIRHF